MYVLIHSAWEGPCVRYNTVSKEFTQLRQYPTREDTELCTAVFNDDKIILCGDSRTIMDIYDTKCEEWKESSLMLPWNLQDIFAMVV